jgi:Flp pilus assembly protein TadG
LRDAQGAALLEFAISLPLLVVFVVGIYDFSGAFNEKQKIEQAAQEGVILAGAQPMSDIDHSNGNPGSLQQVVAAVFKSLDGNHVVAQGGTCTPAAATVTMTGYLEWTYTIHGCPDDLTVRINRGWVPQPVTSPSSVGTLMTVIYPYHWRFNSVIQLLIPGATYSATTFLTETVKVHNQL